MKIRGLSLLVLLCAWLCPAAFANTEQPQIRDFIEHTDKVSGSVGKARMLSIQHGPEDPYNRGTPRLAFGGFLLAAAALEPDPERVLAYFEPVAGLSQDALFQRAMDFKLVLDQVLWVDLAKISNLPDGLEEDGLPKNIDMVGDVRVEGERLKILLKQVEREDGVNIWKLSAETIANIPAMYQAHGYSAYADWFSERLPSKRYGYLAVWQWVAGLTFLGLVTLALFPFIKGIDYLLDIKYPRRSDAISGVLLGPIYTILALTITRDNLHIINPSIQAQAAFEASTLLIFAYIWFGWRFVELLIRHIELKFLDQGRKQAVRLLPPLGTAIKLTVLIVGTLTWINNLGYNITTVLAGLGIGGLAVALATQKSLENFIGCLTLYLSSPVKVGEFCLIDGRIGMIESIGLRATTVITLDKTHLIIPNADLAQMKLENLTRRQAFRYTATIPLHLYTSPAQLRLVLKKIREMMLAHPTVRDKPIHVRFDSMEGQALTLKLLCLVDVKEIADYKAVREDLNLRILDIIKDAGVDFASVHVIQHDQAPYEAHSEPLTESFKQTDLWQHKAPLPTFDAEVDIQKIQENPIKYPVT